MDTNAIRPERANQIQIFRFAAFFMVFYYHVQMFDPGILNYQVISVICMFFFYCMTGVAASYSLFARRNEVVTSEKIFKYIRKKIVRFYPLYFLTNIYAVSYSGLAQYISAHDYKNVLRELAILFKDLSMVRSIVPWEIYSHNGVTWFVSAMLFISVLNLPLNRWIGSVALKKQASIRLMFFAIGGVIYSFFMYVGAFLLGIIDAASVSPIVIVGMHVAGMAIGYLTFIFMDRYPKDKYNGSNIFTILEIVTIACWFFAIFQKNIITIGFGCPVTLFLLFIFMIGYGKVSDILKSRPLVHLGDISYECFMVHQIVIHEYCQNNGWENYNRSGKVFGFFMCMIVTVLIADFLHRVSWKSLRH